MQTVTNLNTNYTTYSNKDFFAVVAEHDLECTKPKNTYLYAVTVANYKTHSCHTHDFLLNKPLHSFYSIEELKEAIANSTVYFAQERQALRELALTKTAEILANSLYYTFD